MSLNTLTDIQDVTGFNPLGPQTTPFHNTNNVIGLGGNSAIVTANKEYMVYGYPLLISSSGGTAVSITIKDSKGATIDTGLTGLTLVRLLPGYKINWGGFSGAPSVKVHGV